MEIIFESTLPSFVKDYLFSLVKKKRQPSTIKRYLYDLEDFFLWLYTEKNDQSFSTWSRLTTFDIEKYLELLVVSRKYQPRTTKRVLTVINQLYKYYDNLGLSKNPILHINQIEIDEQLMKQSDFLTDKEIKRLFLSVRSKDGLSEKQLCTRHFIVERNEAIFILFLYYGLTLQELTSIKVSDVHFETNTITIHLNDQTKELNLSTTHKQVLYSYYQQIPKPVRPRYHQSDPFFIAFDFQRGTYRWVYEDNKPKKLTPIAVQRMIQKEIKRGGLKSGTSAQHFRNSYILLQIKQGKSISSIQKLLGLKTDISLKKYFHYYESLSQ